MKRRIPLATLAVLPIAMSTAHASGQVGTVTIDSLNVRDGAGSSYNLLFTLSKDDKVEILESSDEWYKIKTSSGKEGWASSNYIDINSGSSRVATTTNTTIKTVNASSLNVRSGAGTSYRVIGTLYRGNEVEVISESNGWAKIKYDGKNAYVASQYLEEQSNSTSVTKEVTASSLNVRSGPATSNSVVGKLSKGTKVQVLSESNGWARINYNGSTAYVSSEYLKDVSNSGDSIPGDVVETKEVTVNALNVRSGPGTSYDRIGQLNKGDKVGVISESNGWSKINYNGRVAYVSTGYLKSETPDVPDVPENPGDVVETKEVTASTLNVRSGASTSYSIVGKLNKGDKVGVISESNGWSKINYNGSVAYVSTEYLKSETPDVPDVPDEPDNPGDVVETKEVTASTLNVRSGAGTSYGIVGKLYKGDKVGVISESNGWSNINYNGQSAYVSSQYLKEIDTNVPDEPDNPEQPNPDSPVQGTVNYINLNYTLKQHVDAQMERVSVGGNVIHSSKPRSSSFLSTFAIAETVSYVPADRDDLEYFLNPANFTNSQKGMLQFLRIDRYTDGITASKLDGYLNSLEATSPGYNVFYNQGQNFINAAKKYNIDVTYLVAHSMWETGYGKSTLAQGQTLTHYKGEPLDKPVTVYNFFGIGAIDGSANLSGAEAAYANGWTSVEATIDGSAKWISENYIHNSKYNQNNIYKMKYNYDYTWHQYATDVNWANGISGIMERLISMYPSQSNLVYDVPVYK